MCQYANAPIGYTVLLKDIGKLIHWQIVHYCTDLNQIAFCFYGTRMKLIKQMTTDLFILFTDNQGKRKSDPLSSFYPPHPCAIENTKPFRSCLFSFELNGVCHCHQSLSPVLIKLYLVE